MLETWLLCIEPMPRDAELPSEPNREANVFSICGRTQVVMIEMLEAGFVQTDTDGEKIVIDSDKPDCRPTETVTAG